MKKEKIENLFNEYEKSFDKLDLETIAGLYAEQFISAGPNGTIAQGKQDFLEKAGQAAAFYKSVGQTSARILSKRIIPISNEYCMVEVNWASTFKKTGDKPIEFVVSYLVQDTDDEPKILLFISHEDEEKAMKKLGLLDKQAVG